MGLATSVHPSRYKHFSPFNYTFSSFQTFSTPFVYPGDGFSRDFATCPHIFPAGWPSLLDINILFRIEIELCYISFIPSSKDIAVSFLFSVWGDFYLFIYLFLVYTPPKLAFIETYLTKWVFRVYEEWWINNNNNNNDDDPLEDVQEI